MNSQIDKFVEKTTSKKHGRAFVGIGSKAVLKQGSVAPVAYLPVIESRRRSKPPFVLSLRALKARSKLLNDKITSSH